MATLSLSRRGGRWGWEAGRTIAAPADDVWRLLTDTERWPDWGPSVRRVWADSRFIETGTEGQVVTTLGPTLPFAVTDCEPYRWTWRVAGVRATGHRVEADPTAPDDGCRVVFEVPAWAPFYLPVCVLALRRIARLEAGD